MEIFSRSVGIGFARLIESPGGGSLAECLVGALGVYGRVKVMLKLGRGSD